MLPPVGRSFRHPSGTPYNMEEHHLQTCNEIGNFCMHKEMEFV